MSQTRSDGGSDGNQMVEEQDQEIATKSLRRSRAEDEAEATAQEGTCSKRAKVNDFEKDDNSVASVMAPKEFQQILREGKAERKRRGEEKRLEGLRQIRERKSRTGVDPLEQFPEVVWTHILNNLTPSDKSSMWGIHPLFRDILESNRIRELLFPLILNHRTGFIQGYIEGQDSTSRSALFELRLVSKSIRNAVDSWFDEDFRSGGMESMKESEIACWNIRDQQDDYFGNQFILPIEFRIQYDADTLEKISEMKKPMRIFQRGLEISLCNYDGDADEPEDKEERRRYFNLFKKNVTQALEQVGDQIWRLYVNTNSIEKYGVSPVQFYSILREWIHFLPNLKFIRIFLNHDVPSNANDESQLIGQALLKEQPFPTLARLEGFDFEAPTKDNLWSVCEAITAANPHIKMFICNEYYTFAIYSSQRQTQSLRLEMCHYGKPDDPEFLDIIPPPTPNPYWNLKRLDMYFTSEDGPPISSFIKFLNHYPTLEVVFLGIDWILFSEEENEENVGFLRLPNLLRFSLEFEHIEEETKYTSNSHFFYSLQFLLHSRKLESIEWIHSTKISLITLIRQIDLYKKSQSEETLDFGGGFMDLNNSNLWDAFPRLEHVHVKCGWMDVDQHLRKYRS